MEVLVQALGTSFLVVAGLFIIMIIVILCLRYVLFIVKNLQALFLGCFIGFPFYLLGFSKALIYFLILSVLSGILTLYWRYYQPHKVSPIQIFVRLFQKPDILKEQEAIELLKISTTPVERQRLFEIVAIGTFIPKKY